MAQQEKSSCEKIFLNDGGNDRGWFILFHCINEATGFQRGSGFKSSSVRAAFEVAKVFSPGLLVSSFVYSESQCCNRSVCQCFSNSVPRTAAE
jgi:hypothetical protein